MPWAAKAMAWVAMAMPRASKEKTSKEVAWAATAMPRQYQGNEMPRHANGLHGNAEVCHGHTMPCSGPAMPRISKNIFPKVFQEKKQMIFVCDVWFAPPPPFPKNVFPKVFERKKNKMILVLMFGWLGGLSSLVVGDDASRNAF
jgi:hypothetical protein